MRTHSLIDKLTALIHVQIRIGGAIRVALQVDGHQVQDPDEVRIAAVRDWTAVLALVQRMEQLVLPA